MHRGALGSASFGGTAGHLTTGAVGVAAPPLCIICAVDERARLAEALGRAFLDGPWNTDEVAERGAGCLDRWPDWMSALAFRVVGLYRRAPVDEPQDLIAVVERFLAAQAADAPAEAPPVGPPARHAWPVEPIDSVPDLAERLELSFGVLTWLADVRSLERTVSAEELRNYRYRLLARSSGLPLHRDSQGTAEGGAALGKTGRWPTCSADW